MTEANTLLANKLHLVVGLVLMGHSSPPPLRNTQMNGIILCSQVAIMKIKCDKLEKDANSRLWAELGWSGQECTEAWHGTFSHISPQRCEEATRQQSRYKNTTLTIANNNYAIERSGRKTLESNTPPPHTHISASPTRRDVAHKL